MRVTSRAGAIALAMMLLLAAPQGAAAARAPKPAAPVVIPTGEAPADWRAIPADGVSLAIGADAGARGKALKLDFDFHGGGGYAVAHRAVSLDLPEHYAFTFRVRGNCKPNTLEFKLLDASGDNVWWVNQRDFVFTPEGRDVKLKQRHITFAWGPLGGGEPHHVAGIEFAVTASQGGQGTVWIEDLKLVPLPAPDTVARAIVATATSGRASARRAVDADAASAWTSEAKDAAPALTLDLGAEREFGGLVLDWAGGRSARDYAVELSDDGRAWRTVHVVSGGNGGRDPLYLPESEARWIRVAVKRVADPSGVVALANVAVEPLEWSSSIDRFFMAIAKDAPRGSYPRATLGENVFWTVAGVDNDAKDVLIDEVGRIEPDKGSYSLEPFVRDGGRLRTWNDVATTTALERGDLPIPSVTWSWDDQRLEVRAIAAGSPGHSALVARYRLTNLGASPKRETLYVAVRPFQVNPPTQFLNAPGGATTIRELALDGRVVRVNGDRGVEALTTPTDFGAAAFDQGDVVEYLREGRLPRSQRMPDDFGHGSGALAWDLEVPAGGTREVALLVPLSERPVEPVFAGDEAVVKLYVEGLERVAMRSWSKRLDEVSIQLPDHEVTDVLRAQLGYVLVNRAGPAIQPGTRAYCRSWIRDGCLTSSALLKLGETETVRQFIEWFVPHQYANGKSPCCVDSRGSDPTPEHDSTGELIFLIAQYVRYTGDRAFAESMWPHVASAAAYLDTLRAQRRTAEWASGDNARFFGLLPPSISHEGYSAKPMHAYWDDLFALRGFKDAAWLASWLGKPEAASLARDRDEFATDLAASIRASMRVKGIAYVPGCADLGDFDATSTSIALDPVDAGDVVPHDGLVATYEKYWDFFRKRRDGIEPWDAFTPYEWRNVGAMARLGAGTDSTWRQRSYEALQWLMGFQRPPGFQHWAEVVCSNERAPRFLGDMPHTWVGSDYLRTVLDMLAYEDEHDSSLVIGAGVPLAWLADSGVVVRDLHTRWGPVSFTIRGDAKGGTISVSGDAFRIPPGGIVLRPPGLLPFGGERGGRTNVMPSATLPFSMSWENLAPGAKPAPKPAPRRSSGSPHGNRRRSP